MNIYTYARCSTPKFRSSEQLQSNQKLDSRLSPPTHTSAEQRTVWGRCFVGCSFGASVTGLSAARGGLLGFNGYQRGSKRAAATAPCCARLPPCRCRSHHQLSAHARGVFDPSMPPVAPTCVVLPVAAAPRNTPSARPAATASHSRSSPNPPRGTAHLTRRAPPPRKRGRWRGRLRLRACASASQVGDAAQRRRRDAPAFTCATFNSDIFNT